MIGQARKDSSDAGGIGTPSTKLDQPALLQLGAEKEQPEKQKDSKTRKYDSIRMASKLRTVMR